MAQLSDDCFAFGGPMLSVDEAVGLIAARVTPVREVETVALVDADGRVLARDVAPPRDRSDRGRRSASLPARRCPTAPIPCSCRKTSALKTTTSCFRRG